ncbi:Tetratricopeptide repeat-containing protein [Yoonia tamlensis]|uniref:Tetratricopeptide repeat-containing protein n=1 Tax=Yoonia tamlensis TaxID=390270 RepID=A0A1I6GZT3_9RHOB|nr:tetratricopeptide repeat-containing sulfotransferase family protein [Yoonia tamlensis]SFR47699.1 Tetratricopeptide repeat-containing protein [Yoonia tamlensis]
MPHEPPSKEHILRTLQIGVDLQRDQKYLEAERIYQSVLRADPRHADALNLMGTLSIEAKNFDVALDYFAKALRRSPRNPVYNNNMGSLLLRMKRNKEARQYLSKAIQARPNFVEALCNLAKAHKLMLNGVESEKLYRRALLADPDSLKARLGLADLLIDNGSAEDAAVIYEDILREHPSSVEALLGLAASRKFAPDAPEIDLILQQIEAPATPDDALIQLHHAAGKILNDQRRYGDAIKHFSIAKTYSKGAFDLHRHKLFYRSLIETLTPEFFAERSDFGSESERPVFIVGMPRSGTTLTEQICASHPDVYGAGELSELHTIARLLGHSASKPNALAEALIAMTKRESKKLADLYLSGLKKHDRKALRVVDKMPHNYEFLGLISLLFPNAKIINCNRDPMDNCLSCFMHRFSESHGYNADLETIGYYYRQYRELMDHWQAVLPTPILLMQYEETVADLETRAQALIDFAGLPWDPACLAFHETERTVRTPSRWQVRQPIYTTSVKRWTRYGEAVEPLKSALGNLLDE